MDRPASRLYRAPANVELGAPVKTNHRVMVETLANLRRAAETPASYQPRSAGYERGSVTSRVSR